MFTTRTTLVRSRDVSYVARRASDRRTKLAVNRKYTEKGIN